MPVVKTDYVVEVTLTKVAFSKGVNIEEGGYFVGPSDYDFRPEMASGWDSVDEAKRACAARCSCY